MPCYVIICKALLVGSYSEVLSARQKTSLQEVKRCKLYHLEISPNYDNKKSTISKFNILQLSLRHGRHCKSPTNGFNVTYHILFQVYEILLWLENDLYQGWQETQDLFYSSTCQNNTNPFHIYKNHTHLKHSFIH